MRSRGFIGNTSMLPDGGPKHDVPIGPIDLLESTGRSSYHSVWLLGKRTFSRGLSFLASYTYADSRTDAPTFRSPANEAECRRCNGTSGSRCRCMSRSTRMAIRCSDVLRTLTAIGPK
jgi:hypothetical protein